MKRSSLGVAALCFLSFQLVACQHGAVAPSQNRHASSFGFEAEIPTEWHALPASDLPEIGVEEPSGALANIDPDLLADFSRAIQSGEVEVFYRPNPAVLGFTDNVSVRSTPGGLPANEEDVLASCEVLAQTLSAAYGRPVTLSVCELREVASQRSLYVEASGAVEGVHSMQYLIDADGGKLLIVTATAITDTLPDLRSELDSMVGSLELE